MSSRRVVLKAAGVGMVLLATAGVRPVTGDAQDADPRAKEAADAAQRLAEEASPTRPSVQPTPKSDEPARADPRPAPGKRTILIDSPRPLADLSQLMGERFGRVVTYEDPPFASARDVRPLIPGLLAVVPRNQTVSMSLDEASPDNVLDAAVRMHNRRGGGGRYSLVSSAGITGLVPDRCEDATGKAYEHRSVLDNECRIVFEGPATCAEAMDKLLVELNRSSPATSIAPSRLPRGTLSKTAWPHARFEGTARAALNEILSIQNAGLGKGSQRMTWQLRYAP